MNYLQKLPGFQRSAAGLEWRIWRRLHWIWLAGTVLPLLASAASCCMNQLDPSAAGQRSTEQFFYMMLGAVLFHWTLVLTLAMGCIIVMLMKGPAYVADAYRLPQPGDVPKAH